MGVPHLRAVSAGLRWLVPFLALACLASLGLTGPAAASPTIATVTTTRLVARAEPGPGDDFPLLPKRCDDPRSSFPISPCPVLTFRGRPTMVVFGDSHALMYLPAIRRVAERKRISVVVIFGGSCPPAIPVPEQDGGYGTYCEKHDAEALTYLSRLRHEGKDVRIIVGGFWSAYREVYGETRDHVESPYSDYQVRMAELAHYGTQPLFDVISQLGFHTDVIAQAAVVPPDARPCAAGEDPYECTLLRSTALGDEIGNRRWLAEQTKYLIQPRVIDTNSVYCSQRVCRPRVHGLNVYYDDIHLGASLTRTMTSFFAPSFAHWD